MSINSSLAQYASFPTKMINVLISLESRIHFSSVLIKVWMKIRTSTFWEKDVAKNNEDFFKENFRISRNYVESLCTHLEQLKGRDNNHRKCIPLRKKIEISLYAHGSSAEHRMIANIFGVGKCTVGKILKDFSQTVWNVLAQTHFAAYTLSKELMMENINGFLKLGFSQCLGAIDMNLHLITNTDYYYI